MKKGDIVFAQGKGLIGKTIRFFDKGKFSHVAIAVSDKHVIEADYDTSVAITVFDPREYSYIEIIDLNLTEDERNKVVDIGIKYIGRRYDYLQLIWYVFKKIFRLKGRNLFNNPKNMICSELVWRILDEMGVIKELDLNGIHYGIDLTPNQLYDLLKHVSKNKRLKISTR